MNVFARRHDVDDGDSTYAACTPTRARVSVYLSIYLYPRRVAPLARPRRPRALRRGVRMVKSQQSLCHPRMSIGVVGPSVHVNAPWGVRVGGRQSVTRRHARGDDEHEGEGEIEQYPCACAEHVVVVVVVVVVVGLRVARAVVRARV